MHGSNLGSIPSDSTNLRRELVKVFSFRIPDQDRLFIEAKAKEMDMQPTVYVRQLVSDAITQKRAETTTSPEPPEQASVEPGAITQIEKGPFQKPEKKKWWNPWG